MGYLNQNSKIIDFNKHEHSLKLKVEKKHSVSANLGRHLEFCRDAYFVLKVFAKFSEDINHSRAITSGRFSVGWF